MFIDHVPPALSGTATQLAPQARTDRLRLGVGPDLRTGVRVGIRLDPDPQTDPLSDLTAQVSGPLSVRQSAATDPLGVSTWGNKAIGDCL
jgi:hypothetical protein